MARQAPQPPDRLVWAVADLPIHPDAQVLEVGCGRGVAAALLCQRLVTGRVLGLDRSAGAVAAAQQRCADQVAAGRAEFRVAALEDLEAGDLGGPSRFDAVLAVNVNLFWVRPAQPELQLLATAMRPGGVLRLVYDPPDAGSVARLQQRLGQHLEQAGYRWDATTAAAGSSTLLAVTAQPSPREP